MKTRLATAVAVLAGGPYRRTGIAYNIGAADDGGVAAWAALRDR